MKTFKYLIILLLPLLILASCKKDKGLLFSKDFTGIYFDEDSVNYSFSVTPIEVHSHLLKVPVEIMGMPTSEDRVFGMKMIPETALDSGTLQAEEGNQFTFDGDLIIPADSIHGYIPMLINRDTLGAENYIVRFQLVEKNGMVPANKPHTKTVVVFNNRVSPPKWKDFNGDITWPDMYLGAWNPLTYIKFIELFRDLKNTAPETYKGMVAEYGEDLANPEYGWFWDYANSMKKYILIPLYQYFNVEHPELGVTIPDPNA